MEAEETRWNQQLSRWGEKLSGAIDKQPKARQLLTDGMILKQNIGKVIFMVHVDGSETFSSEYSDPSSQKVFLSLFRGFIIEAFQKLGIFAPADGSDPFSARFQALITIARSFAEQNFDEKLFERLLANPGTPFPGFLGNIHQKIIMFFVRNKTPGLPMRAIGVLMRSSKNVVDKYLSEITRKKNDLGQIHKGYQIRYHFYKIEGLVPPLLSTSNFAADRKTWEKLVELSYRCLDGRVNIAQNNLESPEPNLVATRIFSNEAYIGVGYATPLPGKIGKIGSFPVILFSSLFFLWAGITGSMAVFLTWSLPAFQKATSETSRGNFTWKLDINQRDEFGELETAFNSMVKGLLEKEKMSRFVSEEVVEAVKSEESTALEIGGKKTFYTLLFSDIRNFTTLTEKNSPEEMVSMLNDYFTSMETCIQNHDGSISTFIGDAILAVFFEKEDGMGSAQRACMAAQEMRAALENFNELRRKTGKFTIKTGIGISCGEGLSGRIGSDSGRLVQLVLGDPVERANCLEALSKKTGGSGIIIDAEISSRISEFLDFHPLPANLLPEELKFSKIFELL